MSRVVSVLVAAVVLAVLPVSPWRHRADRSRTCGRPAAADLVTATYTSTFDVCTSSGYRGWFPYANEVPASQPCREDDNTLTYVGELEDDSGTQVGTDTFTPSFTRTKDLPVRHAGRRGSTCSRSTCIRRRRRLRRRLRRRPRLPRRRPKADQGRRGPSDDDRRGPFARPRRALRDRYGSRFARSTLTRACHRLSTTKVRCRVAWRKKPFRYRGTVTMWNDPHDAESSSSTGPRSSAPGARRLKPSGGGGAACRRPPPRRARPSTRDRVAELLEVGQRVVVAEQAEVQPAVVGDDRDRERVLGQERDREDLHLAAEHVQRELRPGHVRDEQVEQPRREVAAATAWRGSSAGRSPAARDDLGAHGPAWTPSGRSSRRGRCAAAPPGRRCRPAAARASTVIGLPAACSSSRAQRHGHQRAQLQPLGAHAAQAQPVVQAAGDRGQHDVVDGAAETSLTA